MFDKLEDMSQQVMKKGYKYFKSQTPKKTGYARSRTRLEKKERIGARYAYADRLDNGWSKQSPSGMSDPIIEELGKLVEQYIKRVT